MTFRDIQLAVIKDGFSPGDLGDVKNWIIGRHAWLWDLDEWTFREGTAAVTFTANSQIVGSLPGDFRIATALYASDGSLLQPIRDSDRFFNAYNTNLTGQTGAPEAYTVYGGQILVGPTGDGSTGLLIYEKNKPALINDSDLTGLPDGYDMTLVHGAKAEGFKLKNVPLAAVFDQNFTAGVNALQRNYLTGIRGQVGQMGAYRPGGY